MILLAVLAMMNSAEAEKPAEPQAAPQPPAVTKMCKDVLGRTVRCNPN